MLKIIDPLKLHLSFASANALQQSGLASNFPVLTKAITSLAHPNFTPSKADGQEPAPSPPCAGRKSGKLVGMSLAKLPMQAKKRRRRMAVVEVFVNVMMKTEGI